MKAVKAAARSMARQAARGSEDEAGAGNIWDASHWQSGALGDVVSTQWLAACGEGDKSACTHIARSNGALQALLTSSSKPGPPIEAYMPVEAPRPVYVTPKRRVANSGMLQGVLSMLGLTDTMAKSGVKARLPPKMIPDTGFKAGPRYSAVWNDGTIAPDLSDNGLKMREVKHEVGRMLNKIDFSDEVHPRPQKLWKQ